MCLLYQAFKQISHMRLHNFRQVVFDISNTLCSFEILWTIHPASQLWYPQRPETAQKVTIHFISVFPNSQKIITIQSLCAKTNSVSLRKNIPNVLLSGTSEKLQKVTISFIMSVCPSFQNRTHVYMNFLDHKNLGNHLLQLCPKVVKHPVYCTHIPPMPNCNNYWHLSLSKW